MAQFRIKTETEFREDNLWNVISQRNGMGAMTSYFGEPVPSEFQAKCEKGSTIFVWGWLWTKEMYISLEEDAKRKAKKAFKVEESGEIEI